MSRHTHIKRAKILRCRRWCREFSGSVANYRSKKHAYCMAQKAGDGAPGQPTIIGTWRTRFVGAFMADQKSPLAPERMAKRLCELADNPTANGFAPVHPDTLRQAATAIREAVEAETERCAQVGESVKADWQCYTGSRSAAQAVIDGIRATTGEIAP